MAPWDAKDKTFLITGGASGLGAEYAETFLNQGAKTVAIIDINDDLGKATADRLNKEYGNKVVFIKCDVSKEEDVSNAFDSVLAQFKQIDVIINNAGIMVDNENMWRTACSVNWLGLVSFTLKGLKHMRKDEGGAGGTIINISSILALFKMPFLPVYSGSKMAVLHFSQCLAMDPFYENTDIRILTMCLGATDTPLLQNLEMRSYEPNLGKIWAITTEKEKTVFQKVKSAVTAVVHMFTTGPPGSIWLSIDDRPAEDITGKINRVYGDFEKTFVYTRRKSDQERPEQELNISPSNYLK